MVLAAWRGIKVNERTGATYYFSLLGFYFPLTRASTILLFPPECESSPRPCSPSRMDTVAGLPLAKIGPPAAREERRERGRER